MTKIIGLTGGIGAGKSMVAKIFATMGVPVLDADALAKDIMQNNASVKEQLLKAFGQEVYKEGVLDRSFLANIVFSDPAQLTVLNAIVHPVTIQASLDWAVAQESPYVIKEAALLFESGSNKGLEKIIGVQAPLGLRIQRIMNRDKTTPEAVSKRMANQMEESKKMKLCDFVITNDDKELVVPQVLAIHEILLAT